MVKIIQVHIEYAVDTLDKTFAYLARDEQRVQPGVRVRLNFGNHTDIIGYVVSIADLSVTVDEYERALGFQLKEINSVVDNSPLLTDELFELAYTLAYQCSAPLIAVLQTILPPSLKPTSTKIKFRKKTIKYVKLKETAPSAKLTNKQQDILNYLNVADDVSLSSLPYSLAAIKSLFNKGLIDIYDKEVPRNNIKPSAVLYDKKLTLNSAQQKVIVDFLNSEQEVFLLEGVTGSGKTEVYLNLTEHYLKNNLNVIFLVPEISLTPMMIEIFGSRFKNNVIIFHSKMSQGERYEAYQSIRKNEVSIVIGSRSAIFAPLTSIGLIILDEEHSSAYKQESKVNYDAKEVAKLRAKYHKAKVLFGSATPTLESRARALKGVYKHLLLEARVNEKELPECTFINMKQELKSGNYSIVSKVLDKKIIDRLTKKEQIIIMHNRRGYSTFVICSTCNNSLKCPHCNVALTYHSEDKKLRCHYCDFSLNYNDECSFCHSKTLVLEGLGIQKVEEKLKLKYPQASILRMDADTTRTKYGHKEILNQFSEKRADILLGTQMVAKGLDFANVTLVAIIDATIGLNSADFRANEKLFSTVTQLIGRAGRGLKCGEAVIQTLNPDYYLYNYIKTGNYNDFFFKEMQYRKLGSYPPYSYLATIVVSDYINIKATLKCEKVRSLIESNFPGISIFGPSTPYIAKVENKYTKRLLIKSKDKRIMYEIAKFVRDLAVKEKINSLIIDIDPNNL